MFQAFDMDVATVDRDVAYVAMVVHVCCKLFPNVLSVFSHICYKYAYLDVAHVYNGFKRFSVFCKCFRHMFQVFHRS
jgi:hypothetical protein